MHTQEVESLKIKINDMVKITQNSISVTIDALGAFCNTKYNYKEIVNSPEDVEDFVKSANALRDSIGEVMQMVDNTIKKIMSYLSSLINVSKKTISNSSDSMIEKFIDKVKQSISYIQLKMQEIRLSTRKLAV